MLYYRVSGTLYNLKEFRSIYFMSIRHYFYWTINMNFCILSENKLYYEWTK